MDVQSSGLVTYRGAVYPRDCDHIGHMNVASYGVKFDEANWVLFCEIGLTPTYLRGERYGMAGVQQNISYKQELFAGDVIEIRSQMLEVAEKRLCFRHEMRKIEDGSVVAISELVAVHLDKQGHKACPMPDAVRRSAAALVAGQS
jgi:acyl-CoA thioester hydrolase